MKAQIEVNEDHGYNYYVIVMFFFVNEMID